MDRRTFIQASTLTAAAMVTTSAARTSRAERIRRERTEMKKSGAFWPNGARLVVSISMQFEAGAQPERGAESPFPVIDSKYPDLPAGKWYDYGFKEGIPRMLDMFDRVGVKVTSHMVGAAVERNPQLAKEIVERGHEAAGHGQTWTPQFSMTPDEERTSYQASIKTIETATSTRPVGFNAFWLRGTPRTLEILQDLGFILRRPSLDGCAVRQRIEIRIRSVVCRGRDTSTHDVHQCA